VVGNKIYAVGGNNSGGGPCSSGALNVAEVYDIATDTWSPITPPPIPVTQATAVAKGGKVIVIGGCTNVSTELQPGPVQIYNPTTDTWAQGAPMPTGRAALAVGVLGNTAYAIGGIRLAAAPFGNQAVVEAYDIDKDAWSGPLTPKTTSASEIFAAAHGGTLYVPGSGSFGVASGIFEAMKKK
jgi:N-acetylneuraminic acid mutarotase